MFPSLPPLLPPSSLPLPPHPPILHALLPQADPDKWEKQWAGLGEALEGNELVLSDYDVKCGYMRVHASRSETM